jgi:hypothetical protein
MGYAIGLLLLVSLISTGVLMVASTFKRMEVHFKGKEHLIFDQLSALNVALQKATEEPQNLFHRSGDTSVYVIKPWGYMQVLSINTFKKGDTLAYRYFVGQQFNSTIPTLYLPDLQKPLLLNGKVKLKGFIQVTEKGFDRGHLQSQGFAYSKYYEGTFEPSTSKLPPLLDWVKNKDPFENIEYQKIDNLNQGSYSFEQKTAFYQSLNKLELNDTLEGNLIIQSFDTIVIGADAVLKNIAIKAPYIRFANGFKGSVQAVATKGMIIENNVNLLFPSYVVLKDDSPMDNQSLTKLKIGDHSRVLGGILVLDKNYNFRNVPQLQIGKSLVAGMVYNEGQTELRGEIYGSLITNGFMLNAGGGVYGNQLLDCVIAYQKGDKAPIFPYWLANQKTSKKMSLCRF